MRATSIAPSRRTLIVSIVIVLVFSIASPCPVVVEFDDEDRLQAESILRTLWLGTPEQRRLASMEAGSISWALLEAPSTDEFMTHADMMAVLRLIVSSDPDDFVVSTVLSNLRDLAHLDARLAPIFVDAMTHTSPNVRYEVAEFFAKSQDMKVSPMLEVMWRAEDRDWVRLPLARALNNHHSTVFIDVLVELAGSEDPDLAIAAMTTLGGLDDPDVMATITELAASDRAEIASVALWVLGYWFEEVEALEFVLAASRSKDAERRAHATYVLSDFDQGEATLRLIEITTGQDDPEIRSLAICSLEYRTHPMLVPALYAVAADRGNPETLRLDAAAALYWADEPIGDVLIQELGVEEDDVPECDIEESWVGFASSARRVRSPEADQDVACLVTPGGELVSEIPTDQLVFHRRSFELDGDLWAYVVFAEGPCWVPEANLDLPDLYPERSRD